MSLGTNEGTAVLAKPNIPKPTKQSSKAWYDENKRPVHVWCAACVFVFILAIIVGDYLASAAFAPVVRDLIEDFTGSTH